MVVARGEDGQVVGGGDGSGIGALAVTGCESILGDRGLADIISTFCADEETLMAESQVEACSWALQEVGEQPGVDVGLLVEEVEFTAIRALCGQVVGEHLRLQTLGQVVLQLQFGIEAVRRCPRLGESET